MSQLFEVPGWKTSPPPPHGSRPTTTSKKRKRPASDMSKLASVEMNLEKLMGKLKEPPREKDAAGSRKKNTKTSKKDGQREDAAVKARISFPKPLRPVEKKTKESSSLRPSKRQRFKATEEEEDIKSRAIIASPRKDDGLTNLQRTMKQSLDGAKFRMINESLYKSDSQEAHRMMRDDPQVYHEYHKGFRHQVQSWPTNPVEQYASHLASYPPRSVIADLGCGDAALARRLVPKGMTVLSFDLVSDGVFVVEADTCQKIPLPGSEGSGFVNSTGEGQIVDVVVCALSLMGTNWPLCIREAWRILKADGELKIAEVASRFESVKDFESLICSIGFRLMSKDDKNTHFTQFELKKIPRNPKSDKEWAKIVGKGSLLKPCEYKRR